MADHPETDRQRPKVAFDYIKGHLFRVVHADGATGGITPNGGIHVAFFSERLPIPQRETRIINSDGSLGDVVLDQSVIRSAIIREMDFDVVMSVTVAEALASWLGDRVAEAKSHFGRENNASSGGENKS